MRAMVLTSSNDVVGAPVPGVPPVSRDVGDGTASVDDIDAALGVLATRLDARWSSALARGDFVEVTRLVEASHAVHRARMALAPDSIVPARRALP